MSENQDVYDLIVIGAGAAGLTAAGFMGKVGGRVALIEKEKLGGDCTWVGCVPSKALLKVSKMAHTIRVASQYGLTASAPGVDMARVRDYVQNAVQDVYQHETPEVFARDYGVEVIQGEARFVDDHTITVNEKLMKAKKFVIATGARPTIPPIEGLNDVPYFTNINLFENDRLPGHLLVIGAGAIGSEMAQAYARLGAKVTMIDVGFFQRDEPEAAEVMNKVFEREGIRFVASLATSISKQDDQIIVNLQNGESISGDMLLLAVGRTPNVSLDLEKAGVTYSPDGIHVDDFLRTSAKHIYAVGDCTNAPKFTHIAGFQGGIAGRNATLPVLNSKGHAKTFPRVTFTDPEVAQVGLTESEAHEKHGEKVKTYVFSLTHGDRTVAEDDTEGFIKFVYTGGGNLLGATVVAQRAGEMIFELDLAVQNKVSLNDITTMIHAYPTYSDVVRRAVADFVIDELFKGVSGRAIKTLGNVLF